MPATSAVLGPMPTIERRQFPRGPARRPVAVLTEFEGKKTSHDAVTVDFSEQGARIRGDFLIKPGESVHLVIKGAAIEPIPSRVVWTNRTAPTGEIVVGLSFLRPAFGLRL